MQTQIHNTDDHYIHTNAQPHGISTCSRAMIMPVTNSGLNRHHMTCKQIHCSQNQRHPTISNWTKFSATTMIHLNLSKSLKHKHQTMTQLVISRTQTLINGIQTCSATTMIMMITAADGSGSMPQPKIFNDWREFPRPMEITHTHMSLLLSHYIPPTDSIGLHHTAKT